MRKNIKCNENICESGYIIPLYFGKNTGKYTTFIGNLPADGSPNYVIKSFIREGGYE